MRRGGETDQLQPLLALKKFLKMRLAFDHQLAFGPPLILPRVPPLPRSIHNGTHPQHAQTTTAKKRLFMSRRRTIGVNCETAVV